MVFWPTGKRGDNCGQRSSQVKEPSLWRAVRVFRPGTAFYWLVFAFPCQKSFKQFFNGFTIHMYIHLFHWNWHWSLVILLNWVLGFCESNCGVCVGGAPADHVLLWQGVSLERAGCAGCSAVALSAAPLPAEHCAGVPSAPAPPQSVSATSLLFTSLVASGGLESLPPVISCHLQLAQSQITNHSWHPLQYGFIVKHCYVQIKLYRLLFNDQRQIWTRGNGMNFVTW